MVKTRDLEDYEIWEKQQKGTFNLVKKNLQPLHIIILISILIFGWWLIRNQKVNTTYVIVGIGIIIVILIFKTEKSKKDLPIPENVVKILATQSMRRKIGSEYPNGTRIVPTGYCKLRYIGEWGGEMRYWKWEIGFKIRYPDGLKKNIVIIFQPFDGFITGIIGKPTSWSGEEANDLKVLIPSVGIDKGNPSSPA